MKTVFEPGCRHCDYDLRGRRRDDVCSECGAPVRDTWNDRTLFEVPRDTRERLHHGLRRMGWGALSFLVVGIVAVTALTILIEALATGDSVRLVLRYVVNILLLGAVGVTLSGLFDATAAVPLESQPERRLRLAARWCGFMALIAIAALAAVNMVAPLEVNPRRVFHGSIVVILLAVTTTGFLWLSAVFARAHHWTAAKKLRRTVYKAPIFFVILIGLAVWRDRFWKYVVLAMWIHSLTLLGVASDLGKAIGRIDEHQKDFDKGTWPGSDS